MTCRTNCVKVVKVSGKCSDMFSAILPDGYEYQGYVREDLGIGSGDYIEFSYCLDCGTIQGDFPVTLDQDFDQDNLSDGDYDEDYEDEDEG